MPPLLPTHAPLPPGFATPAPRPRAQSWKHEKSVSHELTSPLEMEGRLSTDSIFQRNCVVLSIFLPFREKNVNVFVKENETLRSLSPHTCFMPSFRNAKGTHLLFRTWGAYGPYCPCFLVMFLQSGSFWSRTSAKVGARSPVRCCIPGPNHRPRTQRQPISWLLPAQPASPRFTLRGQGLNLMMLSSVQTKVLKLIESGNPPGLSQIKHPKNCNHIHTEAVLDNNGV